MLKEITVKEFNDAPEIIKFIYLSAWRNSPVGISINEEAMSKYPQYFIENKPDYCVGGFCSGNEASDIERFSEHIINHKTGKFSRHK